ncbi:NAD(P)H-dependent oxidoreductase [Rothia sp. AR01]|uniref:NAD(P)H-dependent oxidoreductase n=1 Tax=Rothia santali TaxID=2949643 RepID=A0A9X2HHZ9_9MICC|nr:CE1759 family FMN reductase [Rothia santali]MCP3424633.1 NAD(P)H-dependent oxidoreductase [Rothia santali]
MTAAPTIAVVTAGLSQPSSTALLADRLVEAARAALRAAGAEPRVVRIDLRGLAHGIADHLTMGFPSGELARSLDALREADAIVAVTPTFKAGYSGLFKSFWDLVPDGEFDGVPALLAATGGTARHSLMIDTALRPLFAYLKADAVPTGVFAATDDFGGADPDGDDSLQRRIDRAAGELAARVLWRAVGSPTTSPAGVTARGSALAVDESSRGRHDESPWREHDDSSRSRHDESSHGNAPDHDAAPKPPRRPSRPEGLPPLRVTPFERLLQG